MSLSLPGHLRCHIRPLTRNASKRAAKLGAQEVFGKSNAVELITSMGSPRQVSEYAGVRLPEIVVTGRANVGKSTLLNAVLGRNDLLFVGKKAGRTRTLNLFRVGAPPGFLTVVDAPGYGSRGRPEWGALFEKYLRERETLRRVYVLLNAQNEPTEADVMMFQQLSLITAGPTTPSTTTSTTPSLSTLNTPRGLSSGHMPHWTIQPVITKVDTLRLSAVASRLSELKAIAKEHAPDALPALISARSPSSTGLRMGVEDIRLSICDACEVNQA